MPRDLLNRLSPDLYLQDPDNWPPVAEHLVSEEFLELFQKRKQAVIKYCRNEWTLKKIEEKFGFKRKDFLKMIKRCFMPSGDGGIIGFAALIPFKRLKHTEGKLYRLFKRFPELEESVQKWFRGKRAGDELPEKYIQIRDVHSKFLEKCAKLGISALEFPFNSKNEGREPLRYYLKRLHQENTDGALAAREGKIAQRNLIATDTQSRGRKEPVRRPYEVVQCDPHQLHAMITILAEDPNHLLTPIVLERPWVIFLIDKASRAILGYYFSLSSEPSTADLLDAVAHALIPWTPKTLTIDGLGYPDNGGLPSGVLPQCAWRVFDLLELDNAWAHTSPWAQERINLVTQCTINLGKSGQPEARAILERFFKTLESRGFHRLPSTTGSNPQDKRRDKPDEKARHYQITLSEIEQILDVIIARYNTTSSSAIWNRTPLDYIKSFDEQKNLIIRTVIDQHRRSLPLHYRYFKRTVRGSAKKGRRPYIEFLGAIYRNEALTATFGMIDTVLTLEVNIKDISSIRAFLPDGSSLGLLRAQGQWGLQPHSLKTREIVLTLMNDNIIEPNSPDPISVYHQQKYMQSRKSAKAASALTKSLKESGHMIVVHPESADGDSLDEKNWEPRQKGWIKLNKAKQR